MYAAILTSIETMEYSWESNFDHFETILYRRTMFENKNSNDKESKQEHRKRFCRDYNRPEGCPKNSPHHIWTGSGQNAVKKLVYHYCATCLIRDKIGKDHPEGHHQCPYKA